MRTLDRMLAILLAAVTLLPSPLDAQPKPKPQDQLLAYRLAAYSEWVRAQSGKLTLSGLLALEAARREPNLPNRTALGRVNDIAPRVEQIVRFADAYNVQISPDNRYLLVQHSEGSPSAYSAWDLERREILFTTTGESVAFSPNSKWVAVHTLGKQTEILSVTDGTRLTRLGDPVTASPDTIEGHLHPMAFSQGGQWFAEFIANGDLLLSSTVDWQVKRTFHGVQRFSFGKDDKWMVIVTKDKAAEAWNLSSNDPPVTIAGAEQVDVVLANQHADIVFFGSSDVEDQMHIWPYAGEMQPLNEAFTWTDPVVISDDGTVAVVHHNNDSDAEDDYDIVVRIAGSKVQPLCRIHLRTGALLNADGTQLIDPATGFLYEASTCELKGRFEASASGSKNQRSAARNDFRHIAVALEGRVTVYTGTLSRSLPDPEPHAPGAVLNGIGRLRPGTWVARSADSRFTAIADDDNLVLRVWEKDEPYVMLENMLGGEIDFTEDGRYVQRDDLRVEPFLTDDLVKETCARMNRNLTTDEWKAYLGKEPYRKTCPSVTELAGTINRRR